MQNLEENKETIVLVQFDDGGRPAMYECTI